MNRKTIAFLAVLVAAALHAAAVPAGAQVVESLWQSGPMIIDGVAQEWGTSDPITDKGSEVQYALRNDGRNLYIVMVFRSPDPRTRARIYPKSTLDYTGMRIFFTTGTKKSKDYGILFQKKEITADALIANMEKGGRPLTEEQKAEIRKKDKHVIYTEEVIKPKKVATPATETADSDAPMFREFEKGPLSSLEFRIPLNRVPALGGLDAKPGQSIMLGFEWGGMTQQIMRDMIAGRSDQSVRAADRGQSSESGFSDQSSDSGEIRGMGGGVGEMNRNPRYQRHSFWISAKLATEK